MPHHKRYNSVLTIPGLFVVLFTSFAPNGYPQTTGNRVEEIRKEVGNIHASKLDVKLYPYSNKCGVMKAFITIYHKNGEVKKIIDAGAGDGDKAAISWNYEYYYEKGQLIVFVRN